MQLETTLCPWEPAFYFFFSSNVPLLIHYSHFLAIAAALSISLLVFFYTNRSTISYFFLLFSGLFSLWALLDVLLWATNSPAQVMLAWSLQVLLEPLIYFVAFLMFNFYLHNTLPSFRVLLFCIILLTPLILLLPTNLNLEALHLESCESVEGPIAQYYTYFLNLFFTAMIIFQSIITLPKISRRDRTITIYFLIGLITFLFAFTSGNIIGSFSDNWALSQYGLFGMPIFAGFLAYSIMRFDAFRLNISSAQILVVALWISICSLFFLENKYFITIVLATLVFTTIVGYLLIRSVQREFEQRKELEVLTHTLEHANVRLKELDKLKSEFVSIASHQLRSPLTAVRGYASMLEEGSFGTLPEKAREAIKKISESSRLMALSVEDYLNVSRIQAGKMRYELADCNICELVENAVDGLRGQAQRKGILLTLKKNASHTCLVRADLGKGNQIIHNLIDNALKYTKEGFVDVSIKADGESVKVAVSDTGTGLSKEDLSGIFEKFERAKDASNINPNGTGLGLYLAQKMARDMGGDVTVSSPGKNLGSTFTLILPLSK